MISIIIHIEDKENVDDICAIGAKDLALYFFPKAGIEASKVRIMQKEKSSDILRKITFEDEWVKELSDVNYNFDTVIDANGATLKQTHDDYIKKYQPLKVGLKSRDNICKVKRSKK